MIEDARVLREDFVPNDVVHRNAEINDLSRTLDPITDGEQARPALITGPSGAGKTTITKFVVERLRERVLGLESIHVNCWQAYTRFRVAYRLLEGLGRSVDVHRQSTAYDVLLERLSDYDQSPVLVVLDEVDQLEDAGIVYDLYRLRDFSFVLITNDEAALLADLDGRVRSRLQTARAIHFDRYSVPELTDILADRAEHGLVPGAIGPEQLAQIADAAAGDARAGLSILRGAAREASDEGSETITAAHVEAAITSGWQAVRQRNLQSLRPEQRRVYELLCESGGLSPGELYEAYAASVEDPRSKRTVRKWVNKMIKYNLVEAHGRGPDRTYEARPAEEYGE